MSNTTNVFTSPQPLPMKERPKEKHELIIAGDISGTNTTMTLYAVNHEIGLQKELYMAHALTGTIDGDFSSALDDYLELVNLTREDIDRMVLGCAGPVLNEGLSVKLTNAQQIYEIRADSFGIETALINDSPANGYAIVAAREKVLDLDYVQLTHTDGQKYTPEKTGQIGIFSPGTGLGTGGMFYTSAGAYEPFASEYQHSRSGLKNKRLDKWLRKQPDLTDKVGENIHIEAILSGPGIERLFNFYRGRKKNEETRLFDSLVSSGEAAGFVSQVAKDEPGSISRKAMDYFWEELGLSLYDVATTLTSTGGLWIGGGIIRKNILLDDKSDRIDQHIEKLLMEGVDRAGIMHKWISKMPVYAVTDPYLGTKGAMIAASIPKYQEQLRFYK